ncbi:MAG: hypothetical protein HRU70_14215 [Phycisphaeraceae bacterium]|nr:MAG: hypothetical protein HRU70_14215 [Phycisphaeraceae bacterium]
MRHAARIAVWVSAMSAAVLSAAAFAPAGQPATGVSPVERVIDGVETVAVSGTPGQLALWGPTAWPVLLGKDGDRRCVVAATASLGRGRVFALTHNGYGSSETAGRADTLAFMINALRWTAGAEGRPARVAVWGGDLDRSLPAAGPSAFEALRVRSWEDLSGRLASLDAVAIFGVDLSEEQASALSKWAEGGKGLMLALCPWGWEQVRGKPVSKNPMNAILAPAGVAFASGYAGETVKGGFAAGPVPRDEFHGGRSLEVLSTLAPGGTPPAGFDLDQAERSAVAAVRSLPAQDRLMRPTLRALASRSGAALVPTPKSPITRAMRLERVLMAHQVAEGLSAEGRVEAHPSADAFPGRPEAGATPTTRTFEIDTSVRGWRSTGLYAPAGVPITVSLDSGSKTLGLSLRVGCHTDALWHTDAWHRAPEVSREWPLGEDRLVATSPFGGLVYVVVPDRAPPGSAKITVRGAVEAPLYVHGVTTPEQWRRARQSPAPWGELATAKVIVSVPSSFLRGLDDPGALMDHWDKVLDAAADLAGISAERARPERYVADVQISAGYMHSGYPIMTHLDAAETMTSLERMMGRSAENAWGIYHELGHNHQEPEWTFDGTVEVTCNLFTLYILERVCGIPPAQTGRVLGDAGKRLMGKHLAGGARFEVWKQDPFVALQMYAQVQEAFGWDPIKAVIAEYRALPPGERPRTEEQKRDQWMVRLSRAVGRDLGPFFVAWGVPTGDAARASIAGLPGWMPQDWPSPVSPR